MKRFLILSMVLGLIAGSVATVEAKGKKKKKPAACAAWTTAKVTDAATEAKPVVFGVPTGPGVGIGRPGSNFMGIPYAGHVSEAFVNFQVDSATPTAGLYVSVEFSRGWEYDLYLDRSTGEEVAFSAGSNVLEAAYGSGAQTETTKTSETILGLETADCEGFAADIVGSIAHGQLVTLKAWLGEIKAPPAE